MGTRFRQACEKGNLEEVRKLVAAGEDARYHGYAGTPLAIACSSGHVDIVKFLLTTDVKQGMNNDVLALWWPCQNGHAAVVQLLLDAGADRLYESDGKNNIMIAAEKGHTEVVRALLSSAAIRAQMGAKNKDGRTARSFALRADRADVVKLLDAYENAQSQAGDDELRLAAENGRTSAVEHLIKIGADKDALNQDGNTALTLAVKGGHAEVVQLLLDAGATLPSAHSQILTDVAQKACVEGRLPALQQLVRAGADLSAKNKVGVSLLMVAAQNGHADAVELLLDTGADKNALNQDGETALILAAKGCHADAVKLLADAGAELDARNTEGDTALLLAVRNGHEATAMVLLEAGANIGAGNAKETAYSVADRLKMKRLLDYVGSIEYAYLRLLNQASQAPQRAEMMKRLEAAQAQYDAAEAAAEDFELIASLGKALQALQRESAQLLLSEEDYLTLPTRRAELVQRIEKKGTVLKKEKDFAGVERLGEQLEALKALNLPTLPAPEPQQAGRSPFKLSLGGLFQRGAAKAPVPLSRVDLGGSVIALCAACDLVAKQASQAPQRAEIIQRLEAAQGQYDAAVTAFTDLSLIASLGNRLVALQQQSSQLPLSEEDYLTLTARHAQLVQRVVQGCKDHVKAKQFDDLITLNGQLLVLSKLVLPKVADTGVCRGVAAQARTKTDQDRLLASCAELGTQCDQLMQQVALAPLRKDVTHRLEAAQAQYDAADAAGDLRSIGALGKALEAVKAESAKIVLTQKDYLTLADRHAQLVQRIVSACQELAAAGKYNEIAVLASKMDAVKALDLSALPPPTAPKAPARASVPSAAKKDGAQRAAADPVAASPVPQKESTGSAAQTETTGGKGKAAADARVPAATSANTTPLTPLVPPHAATPEPKPPVLPAKPPQEPEPRSPKVNLEVAQTETRPGAAVEPRGAAVKAPAAANPAPPVPKPVAPEAVPALHASPPAPAQSSPGDTPTRSGLDNSKAAALVLTGRDRGALAMFVDRSNELMQGNARLQQVMRTVAAHDRTLQMLVSKEKECPSLFWFYPKKPELRRWLSDPAKCLFQDTLMMVVVCPVTLCVVGCGPDGVGWEVNKPKEWVKKWGPAILFSIYVMQAAVVAGRVVGIPLPFLPGAAEVKKLLGLKGVLGGLFTKGSEEADFGGSLAAFQEVTIAELEQTVESQALIEGLSGSGVGDPGAPLPADLPMHMVGEAYKSIHTFLTTGENAKLGELEDQLRGRMERVMAPDGDIEWVSVQGRDAWLQKHAAALGMDNMGALGAADVSSLSPLPISPPPQPSTPSSPAAGPPTWLGEKLTAAGVGPELVELCDRVLVREQGFGSEKRLARTPTTKFHEGYLSQLGITSVGLQLELLDLHRELRQNCNADASAAPTQSTLGKPAAEFTEEDRQLLRQLKLLQRAPEPTATNAVDRGNQMQLTVRTLNQPGPQGAQDQQQLARRIAELEARLARAEGVVTEHITVTALHIENAQGRSDSPLPSSPSPDTGAGAGADVAQKGCCSVS